MGSRLSISKAWDQTRDIFRRDGSLLVSVALALIVLPEVVVGLIAPPQTPPTTSSTDGLLRLAAGLIALVGQLALIRLALGPSTTVGAAIGHGTRRFPATLGAVVLLILALGVLMVPLIIILTLVLGVDAEALRANPLQAGAGMFAIITLVILAISVRFTLVSPVASAEDIGPIAILKRSWNISGGHYWRLLAFILLMLVAMILLVITAGFLGGLLVRVISPEVEPFSLGALILALFGGVAQGAFSVLGAVMLARIYAQVAGRDVEASVPSSGT